MTTTKKATKTAKDPQPLNSIFFRLQDIEEKRRKAKAIEQMIEAKVALALRRLLL